MCPYFQNSNLLSLFFLAKLQSYVCTKNVGEWECMDVWEVVPWFGFVAMGV